MSTDQERSAESFEEQIRERLDVERRPLLKALGAGAALSFGSAAGAASGDGSDDGEASDDGSDARDDGDADSGRIDPVYGYTARDAADIPGELEADHEVEMLVTPPAEAGQPPFLHFEPAGIHVEAGDVVQFTAVTPDHTVTAYHPGIGFDQARVPEEAGPFSSPVIGPGAAWLYRFEHEGVYDVYCGPHHILGMVMRLVVGDPEELPEYAESVEGVPSRENLNQGLNQFEGNEGCEWPYVMPAAIFGTDALHPTSIQEAGDVPFGDVAAELGHELGEAPPEGEGDEAAGPTVRIAEHPEHGEILVDSSGMTLYMFDQDTQGAGESACHDDCAAAWPPLPAEDEPTAGDGVTAELGAFERETGERQVTADGWPLYYFAQDEAPGDANGQGVNDVWWVLAPDGTPVRSE